MQVTLQQVGKRFQRYWAFRNVDISITSGQPVALLGSNGSGKSTLLRIIAGMQTPSAGKVNYVLNGVDITQPKIFQHVSYTAPGQDIIEEMTLREFFEFHWSFKPILSGVTIDKVIDLTGLKNASDRPTGDFSSGMRQRVKLAQAIFTDCPILLLDEPCTNLDQQGIEQYRGWIDEYTADRLVVVASNDPREYFFCSTRIELEQYK